MIYAQRHHKCLGRVMFDVREEDRSANYEAIVCVSSAVIDEIKRIVKQSEIIKEDDSKWPQKNKDGRQELEIRLGGDHISFEVRCRPVVWLKIGHRT